MSLAGSGSAGAGNDYYGVNTTWHAGSSWARPIFDGGYVSSDIISLNGQNYVTIDNLELAHINPSNNYGSGLISGYGESNVLIENSYLHGWRTTAATDDAHGGVILAYDAGAITNVVLDNCEVENSENTGSHQNGVAIRQVQTISRSKIHDVSSAVLFTANFHDNQLYNVCYPAANQSFDPNYHCNGVYLDNGGLMVGGVQTSYVYNNLIHDCSGAANCIYPNPHGQVQYVWNNVVYGVQSGQLAIEIDPYQYGSEGGGSCYVWNNTIVNYNNNAPGIHVVYRSTVKLNVLVAQNNHVIGTGASATDASSSNTISITTDHNLVQDPATASSQGYTLANLYAPTSSSAGTVDQGASESSYFTTDILGVTRPKGSAWDIGAYEYVP